MMGGNIDESAYLRWLLKYNPFVHLSSESLESISTFHVWTETDRVFWDAIKSFLQNKRKSLVFLVGEFGSGKTHRLRLLYEALDEVPCIYIKVDSQDSREVMKGIEAALHSLDIIPARRLKKAILSLAGRKSNGYVGDPEIIAKEAASLLNKRGEAILMMDEIENVILSGSKAEAETFIKYLLCLYNSLDDGKMIVVACVPPAYETIKPFLWGFNPSPMVVRVKRITDEEAMEIIARRLRLVLDIKEGKTLFGGYFLGKKTISEINRLSEGNPRKLMQIFRNILLTTSSLNDKEVKRAIRMLTGKRDREEEEEAPKYEEWLRKIKGKIGSRKWFSIIEAAETMSLPLTDVKMVLKELMNQKLIVKRGVRYYLTENALRLAEMSKG